MSLEMAHKVILPPQKNYIPQFLKQRDINSYFPQTVDLQVIRVQDTTVPVLYTITQYAQYLQYGHVVVCHCSVT
jgi:hypothetical protein